MTAGGIVPTAVLCGMARGADTFGAEWARFQQIQVMEYPAPWEMHGKRAGPIRNEEMARDADALIAIWDGKSPGTRDMINKAHFYGLKVFVHTFTPRGGQPVLPEFTTGAAPHEQR